MNQDIQPIIDKMQYIINTRKREVVDKLDDNIENIIKNTVKTTIIDTTQLWLDELKRL